MTDSPTLSRKLFTQPSKKLNAEKGTPFGRVSTPRPNTSGKGNKKKIEITIKKRETLTNKNYSILFPGYSLGNGLSLNVWCLYGDASGQFVQLILIILFIWHLYLYYLLFYFV